MFDIVFLNRVGEQKWKKLGHRWRTKKVTIDLRKLRQLPFHDEGFTEESGFRFND